MELVASKILIVDDDEAVIQTFERALRLQGCQVRTATTVEHGLAVAFEAHPDAILLDLRMPIVDGLGFLRLLRAKGDHRRTPVAIITGDYFLADDISRELDALGAQLRYKPMWLEDLVALAESLLTTH